jgi:hypothetical protein
MLHTLCSKWLAKRGNRFNLLSANKPDDFTPIIPQATSGKDYEAFQSTSRQSSKAARNMSMVLSLSYRTSLSCGLYVFCLCVFCPFQISAKGLASLTDFTPFYSVPSIKYRIRIRSFFLSVPWRYIGGVGVYFDSFLTSQLEWSEWSTSRPRRFTSRGKLQYPSNMRLGGSQNHSGHYTKRKISCFWRDSIPGPSSTLRSHCTGCTVPARSGALP